MKLRCAAACPGFCFAHVATADSITLTLDRFEIGNDEGTMMRSQIGEDAALIETTRN